MRKPLEREVLAQCKSCKDVFNMYLFNRRGEISVETGGTVGSRHNGKDLIVTHRPGHCDGEVQILWGPLNGDLFPAPQVREPV